MRGNLGDRPNDSHYGACQFRDCAHELRFRSAMRFFIRICRAVGSSMSASRSNCDSVRDTVSIDSPK